MKQAAIFPVSQFSFRLNAHSGVPVYRQLIDQVLGAVATGALRAGDQLPTVRSVAVDLAINPNTVMRAYREMEIRGVLDTQQGAGTYIAEQRAAPPAEERARQLGQLAAESAARAGALGCTVEQLIEQLRSLSKQAGGRETDIREEKPAK